jgi:hypothetical protein
MGIEPTSEAWEASILPLYDARSVTKLAKARLPDKTRGARLKNAAAAKNDTLLKSRSTQFAIGQHAAREFLTARPASVSVNRYGVPPHFVGGARAHCTQGGRTQ